MQRLSIILGVVVAICWGSAGANIYQYLLGQVIHQLARNVQPLLGRIVGYRASIGEDEPPSLSLADSRHDLVVKFSLAAMSNWATFPQPTHQAFVGEGQSLAKAGAGETVAPTHH